MGNNADISRVLSRGHGMDGTCCKRTPRRKGNTGRGERGLSYREVANALLASPCGGRAAWSWRAPPLVVGGSARRPASEVGRPFSRARARIQRIASDCCRLRRHLHRDLVRGPADALGANRCSASRFDGRGEHVDRSRSETFSRSTGIRTRTGPCLLAVPHQAMMNLLARIDPYTDPGERLSLAVIDP